VQNTNHLTNTAKKNTLSKFIFLVFSVLLITSFLYSLFFLTENEQSVQERFNDNLVHQKNDLKVFKEQLSVYSNPFDIEHKNLFRKQVFINDRLIYWSDDALFPEVGMVETAQTIINSKIGSGIVMVESIGDSTGIIIVSYLPIVIDYSSKNQFLRTELNDVVFVGDAVIDLSKSNSVLIFESKTILNYRLLDRFPEGSVYVIFIILVLFTSSGIWWIFLSLKTNRNLVSFCAILISRVIIEVIVIRIGGISIFEPINYTSPYFGNSVGQLLLNVLVVLALVLIFKEHIQRSLGRLPSIIFGFLIPMILIGLLNLYALLISDIIENSQIDLDITSSLLFNDVKLGLLVSIILSMLTLTVLTRTTLSFLRAKSLRYFLLVFSVMEIVILYVNQGMFLNTFPLVVSIGLALFFGFNSLTIKLDFHFFTSLLLIAVGIAGITSSVIYQESEKDTLISKQKFANTLLIHNDFTAELLLNSSLSRISKDGYIRSRFLSEKLSSDLIENRIRNEYLSPYFNKYALDIYLVNNESNYIYNPSHLDFSLGDSSKISATAFPDIYLIASEKSGIPDKYMAEVDFRSIGGELGRLILVFSLKKYIPKSVYPQLLSSQMFTKDVDFDYAVFNNGNLIYKRGKHPFENAIDISFFNNQKLYEEGIALDGFAYYGVETSSGDKIIISTPLYSIQKILQNASFYFTLFLLIWLFILMIYMVTNRLKLSLSSKIQISLSISIFIPMIVVAGALLTTLSTSYRSEIDRNFSKRSFNMAESLIELTEKYLSGKINQAEYANRIVSNAEISQNDLNIYDVNGRLLVSSQPQIFNKNLLSGLINPMAINALKFGNEQGIILDRNIGKVEFKSSYTAIRSYRDGRLLAFLSMPYFDSKNHLRKQQIEVFNNVTIVFTLIFIIAYFAENAFVGRLILPLKKIAEKLSRTKLEESNERLEYDGDDEIGQLVNEYNAMLVKLDESKEALAESQKESAWKEIARQVAHEIKNPLTPMRLRIQQLLRSTMMDDNHQRVLNSLIDQIDSLSSIADSFSAYATMPAPKNERFEIVSVIKSAMEVYQTDDVKIVFEVTGNESYVNTDPKLFSRVMTNIVLNAIQSVKEEIPKISVKIASKEKSVLVTIEDNGEGMSEEVQRNVFKPYFSTKRTGSGIGLAVAKKGIENAGGNIWFESSEGKGTSFFIKLPKE
jgi:two-component system nitrogen regulation sensor histidine kinase NtrY